MIEYKRELVAARLLTEMRLSLILAFGTWLLAFLLRAVARTYPGTVENPRPHTVSPPLSWLGGPEFQLPAVTTVGVPILLFVVILAWWRFRPSRLAATGLGLFLGGAAANTTERLVFGSVTDYLPIPWPIDSVANFADLAVVSGAALVVVSLLHAFARRSRAV